MPRRVLVAQVCPLYSEIGRRIAALELFVATGKVAAKWRAQSGELRARQRQREGEKES
jgi:hypothetical protein